MALALQSTLNLIIRFSRQIQWLCSKTCQFPCTKPPFPILSGCWAISLILGKVKAHAETKSIGKNVFIGARLAPDMYPLSQQIRIAADMAMACSVRLASIESPQYENNEATVQHLFPVFRHKYNVIFAVPFGMAYALI
jgi:hypothetical protein